MLKVRRCTLEVSSVHHRIALMIHHPMEDLLVTRGFVSLVVSIFHNQTDGVGNVIHDATTSRYQKDKMDVDQLVARKL